MNPNKVCDCDNPDCDLPIGRCYLCGSPCAKVNGAGDNGERLEWTVGPCCYAAVDAVYEAERTGCDDDVDEDMPGWALFNGDGVSHGEIQRIDTADMYEGDGEAAEHVADVLGIKPAYPDGA